jgi:uncharacterized hydrophobic protein (TIGR00271 family)
MNKNENKNTGRLNILSLVTDLKNYFNIKKSADRNATVSAIKRDVYLRGSNIWYLICSALIASIGLDINSEAVIIGAMLISPLMTPILGVGLSFGIHDKELLLISLREFIASILISLAVSVIYFLLTPLGNPTDMILSRIKPTLLDVLIGFFGGVAGIVAISRSYTASAIPGVAIATALMPPICVSGFGIAMGRMNIFFGAFYLFFINAVFISFSAYLIVRLLRFPIKEYEDYSKKVRMRVVMLIIIILITVPSIFIFYGIIKEVRLNNKLNDFITKKVETRNRNVIDWKYYPSEKDTSYLNIYLVGEKISDEGIDSLNEELAAEQIPKTKIRMLQMEKQGDNAYLKDEIKTDVLKAFELNQGIKERKEEEERKKAVITDSLKYANTIGELKILYPELEQIAFSKSLKSASFETDTTLYSSLPVFYLKWSKRTRTYTRKANEAKIYDFLKSRLALDTLLILNF